MIKWNKLKTIIVGSLYYGLFDNIELEKELIDRDLKELESVKEK